jgi:hypothetical protein
MAAALLVFAGCPADDPAPDAGPRQSEWPVHGRPGETPLAVPDSIPVEQFCAYLEESICDYQIRCDPTANYQRIESCKLDQKLPTFNCLTRWQYPFMERQQMGTLRYDGAAVTRCLRALKIEQCIRQVPECDFAGFTEGLGILGACCFDSSECSSGYCGDRGPNPEPSTRGRCRAKLAQGSGRCFNDSECEAGLRCSGGICAEALALGESCRGVGTPCADGAFCVGERGDERCELAAAMGMRCDIVSTSFPRCARGLGCQQGDEERFGICVAQIQEGEPCGEDLACSSGLRCSVPDATDGARCTQMGYGSEGEYCQIGAGYSRCDTRNTCRVEAGSREGTCVGYSDLGEVCDGRLPCRRGWCRPANCEDLSQNCSLGRPGICVLYQDLGEPCTSVHQCGIEDAGRFCNSQNVCDGATVNACE